MTTTTLPEPAHSLPGLCAPGRSPAIPVSADRYGRLVASWELDVLFYVVDASRQNLEAEAHFSWAREGRAVQDSPDAFLWAGEALQSDGKTWKLQGQFRARRLAITSFEKGQSL